MAKNNGDNNNDKDSDLSLYLRKGSGAIQIRVVAGKRSLLQRKATNALFKIASDLGFDKQHYITTQSRFSEYSGFNSNDVKYLKEAASNLLDAKVEFDVMNQQQVRHIGASNIFSSIAFRSDGTVYFEIPELTKKMLSNSEHFALINMQVQGNIESNYAYILYEHCLIYLDVGETPSWSIDRWKEFLEIEEDQTTYQEFKYFNNKIIKFAVNEVNKIGDILIEPVYHKEGRVISRMSFKVESKPQAMLNFISIDESLTLQQKIVDYGVSEKAAEKLVKNFDRERILGNIEYVDKQFAAGKVEDLAAFLVRAINDDYRPKESPLVKKVREKQEADLKKAEEQKQAKAEAEKKQKDENAEKNNLAKDYYEGLSEEEKTDLREDFKVFLSKTNALMLGQYKKSGLMSAGVKAQLWLYIKQNRLE